MSYDIKFGIIQELEEKLSETLAKWLEKRVEKSTDQAEKKMLGDLLQGAEEVLNRWL